jgi:hypothetical protein
MCQAAPGGKRLISLMRSLRRRFVGAETKILFAGNVPDYDGELDKVCSKNRIKNCFSRKSVLNRGDVAERLKAAVC